MGVGQDVLALQRDSLVARPERDHHGHVPERDLMSFQIYYFLSEAFRPSEESARSSRESTQLAGVLLAL